ncbi:MAG: LamG-like jellyroll fold domain-containing protein [bacterium]|nr:LamG-like jellyroll fold domain-containing protein [bacterium]
MTTNKKIGGFTLMEVLIYTAILGATGAVLSGVLIDTTKIKSRQTAVIEVNEQLNFTLQNMQRSIRDSSVIDIDAGTSTSTLVLRFKDDTKNPTEFYILNGIVYKEEANGTPQPLTNSSVVADAVNFLKVSGYSGHDSVQIDLTLSYNTTNPASAFSRTLSSAIARVSAATFDSNLIPGAATFYDIGTTALPWNNAYISGSVGIGNTAPLSKLGITGSASVGATYGIIAAPTSGMIIEGKTGIASSSPWGLLSVNPNGITGPAFVIGSSTATNLIITNGGNVGISSTTPGSLFSVGNTNGINFSTATSTFSSTGGIDVARGCFAINGTCVAGGSASLTGSTGQLAYFSSANTAVGTSTIFISTAGKVGIGTTTPESTLDVRGRDTGLFTEVGVDDSYSKTLIHANGTDGSATITDESSKTMTRQADAQIDTAFQKFGTGSILFDGTGDYVAGPTDNVDYEMGSGEFTIDLWYKSAITTDSQWTNPIIAYGDNTGAGSSWKIYGGKYLWAYIWNSSATAYDVTSTVDTSDNAWHHVAFIRQSNTLKLYIDGALQDTKDVTGVPTNDAATAGFFLGADSAPGSRFTGAIDEVRVSKGIARWTANFTPPTSAYGNYNGGKNYFSVSDASVGDVLTVNSSGKVGIGTTAPGTYALSVVGTAGLSTGTAWTSTSDQRWKNVYSELKGESLNKIMALRPVSYRWNALHDSQFGTNPGLKYGFIAQEVKNVIPEMISQDDKGYYWYNPTGMEAILTGAIQDQQKQIEELRAEITGLKLKIR